MLTAAYPLGQGHEDPKNMICEGCEENPAIEYCKDCSMAFCASCKKPHLKTKASAHHQFLSLDEALASGGGGGGSAVSRITRCEKHPQQEINTYCHTDKQAICSECSVDFHKGHEVDRLMNVVQGFKLEISNLVKKVFLFCFFPFLSVFFSHLLFVSSFLIDRLGESRSGSTTASCPRPFRRLRPR